MSVNDSVVKNDFQTYVDIYDKRHFILFPSVIPIENVSPSALRKQLRADLARTFIECCLLMNRVIQFHVSFQSRTE